MQYLTSAIIALIAFIYITLEYTKGALGLHWYIVLSVFCASALYISVRTLRPNKTHQ